MVCSCAMPTEELKLDMLFGVDDGTQQVFASSSEPVTITIFQTLLFASGQHALALVKWDEAQQQQLREGAKQYALI